MKNLLAFTLLVLTAGCGSRTCDTDADHYRSRECAIKIESRYFSSRWITLMGTNAYDTGSQNIYSDLGSWYPLFEKHIAIGDTVVKRKNELVFYIHKKDTVLAFPFTCEGKIIQ